MFVVKVTHGDETRRLMIDDTCTFGKLCTLVRKRFELSDDDVARASLVYVDPDGDPINVDSDKELSEALALLGLVDPPVLRVSVRLGAAGQGKVSSWAAALAQEQRASLSDDSDSVVVVDEEEREERRLQEDEVEEERDEEDAIAEKAVEEEKMLVDEHVAVEREDTVAMLVGQGDSEKAELAEEVRPLAVSVKAKEREEENLHVENERLRVERDRARIEAEELRRVEEDRAKDEHHRAVEEERMKVEKRKRAEEADRQLAELIAAQERAAVEEGKCKLVEGAERERAEEADRQQAEFIASQERAAVAEEKRKLVEEAERERAEEADRQQAEFIAAQERAAVAEEKRKLFEETERKRSEIVAAQEKAAAEECERRAFVERADAHECKLRAAQENAAVEVRERQAQIQIALAQAEDAALYHIQALAKKGASNEQLETIFSQRVVAMMRREAALQEENAAFKDDMMKYVVDGIVNEVASRNSSSSTLSQQPEAPQEHYSDAEEASVPIPTANEPCTAALVDEEAGRETAELAARLGQFYLRHNPSSLDRVPAIIRDFSERGDVLNELLRQKYGADLTSTDFIASVSQPVRETDASPSAPPGEDADVEDSEQMKYLFSMGFTDRGINSALLDVHSGNVERVVDELLSN